MRRISPVGHEKIIRGTGDPDERGRVPIQGGSRNPMGEPWAVNTPAAGSLGHLGYMILDR